MHTTRITLCSTAYELDTPSGTVKRAFDPVIIGAAYVRGVQQGPHVVLFEGRYETVLRPTDDARA